jgi:TDG/mug DNA glycosylase family protein
VPPLRDVIADRPKILFVGINPGETSGRLGHHFARAGNPFWKLLHAAKLTPVVLRPDEDQRLAEHGYALTNLCARVTRTAAELTRAELARGNKILREKIRAMQPGVVALVGLTMYPPIFGRSAGGPGAKAERLEDVPVFVVPNPSGLNASFPSFEAKLVWFEALARYAKQRRKARRAGPRRRRAAGASRCHPAGAAAASRSRAP